MGDRYKHVEKAWLDHKAGDPGITKRLLTMLKSWKEYDDIRQQIQDEASVCEQDVRSEGQEDIQKS